MFRLLGKPGSWRNFHHLATNSINKWPRSSTSLPFSTTVGRPRLGSQQFLRFKTTTSHTQSFSSYEYPLRNEAPVISRTTAKDARHSNQHSPYQKSPQSRPLSPTSAVDDPFDDQGKFSEAERDLQLAAQKQHLSTTLHVNNEPISTHIPKHIPPNAPSETLKVPHTEISSLDNGIRVVSQETYGQVCTVGVLWGVGSRHEQTTGTCHLLELLAFHSTEHPLYSSANSIQQALQRLGGTSFCNFNREQALYCLDLLRPNVQTGMELLQQVVLEPRFDPIEVRECLQAMEYQSMDLLPEMVLSEALQEAAYGRDQQLGKPHFCPLDELPGLNAGIVRDFHRESMVHNPRGLVVAGAGVGHEELCDMAHRLFGDLVQHNYDDKTPETIPSTYRGGEHHTLSKQSPTSDGLTRIALAFEVGGWHSQDLVPACVLQTLLGGGNSFSAGGPGKGMYSRLYRQVLNRYYWAESAEAFASFQDESGLLGIGGSSLPAKSRDVARVLAEHFEKLGVDLVSDEELSRARNMLKCNVLTQLESRLVLFEDIGRQVLTYGERQDIETMCRKIDAVEKEDLRNLVRRALEKPLSVAAVGEDLGNVPSLDDISGWFH